MRPQRQTRRKRQQRNRVSSILSALSVVSVVSALSKELISREAHITLQFSPFTFQIKRPRLLGLCDGETGESGYCGESGYKPQHTQFAQYPHKAAQSDGLQWVTISYYEHRGIDNENIVTHRSSSEPIETHSNSSEAIKQTSPSTTTQFLGRSREMWCIAKETIQG